MTHPEIPDKVQDVANADAQPAPSDALRFEVGREGFEPPEKLIAEVVEILEESGYISPEAVFGLSVLARRVLRHVLSGYGSNRKEST